MTRFLGFVFLFAACKSKPPAAKWTGPAAVPLTATSNEEARCRALHPISETTPTPGVQGSSKPVALESPVAIDERSAAVEVAPGLTFGALCAGLGVKVDPSAMMKVTDAVVTRGRIVTLGKNTQPQPATLSATVTFALRAEQPERELAWVFAPNGTQLSWLACHVFDAVDTYTPDADEAIVLAGTEGAKPLTKRLSTRMLAGDIYAVVEEERDLDAYGDSPPQVFFRRVYWGLRENEMSPFFAPYIVRGIHIGGQERLFSRTVVSSVEPLMGTGSFPAWHIKYARSQAGADGVFKTPDYEAEADLRWNEWNYAGTLTRAEERDRTQNPPKEPWN